MMKHFKQTVGSAFLGTILAVNVAEPASLGASEPAAGDYDLATIQVEDRSAAGLLGSDTVRVRKKAFTITSGKYPVVTLHRPSKDDADAVLEEIVKRFSDRVTQTVQDKGDVIHTQLGDQVYWVTRASGAYSYTDLKRMPSKPATIEDHKQAVQLALRKVADLGLVELGEREELDVISVHQVMTAVVYDDEEKPFSSYGSDYIVKLGRRYQGIPVIGSYLQLQLGPNGDLVSVRRLWRAIDQTAATRHVEIDTSQLTERLHSLIQSRAKSKSVSEKESDIQIVNTACGYVEGQMPNVQEHMALGCLIHYRYSSDEMVANALIPLAEYDFPIAGKPARFASPAQEQAAVPSAGKDPDDKTEDEAN